MLPQVRLERHATEIDLCEAVFDSVFRVNPIVFIYIGEVRVRVRVRFGLGLGIGFRVNPWLGASVVRLANQSVLGGYSPLVLCAPK